MFFICVLLSTTIFYIFFFVERSFNIKGEGGVGERGIKMPREGGGGGGRNVLSCVCGGERGIWGQKEVGGEYLLFSLYR